MIYLDANVIIAFIEGHEHVRNPIAERLRGATLSTSLLSRLECRVAPLRAGDTKLLSQYDGFFSSHDLNLAEISAQVLDHATEIRARFNLTSPDAIHLATACSMRASMLLSADHHFKRCRGQVNVDIEILNVAQEAP